MRDFKNNYKFKGRITIEEMVNNLNFIRNHITENTLLVIMLGSEVPFENNHFEAYMDRHELHKKYNDAVRLYAKDKENVKVLDVNKYITGQDCFYKHINHFTPKVYYEMAQDMVKLINDWIGITVAKSNKAMKNLGQIKLVVKKS